MKKIKLIVLSILAVVLTLTTVQGTLSYFSALDEKDNQGSIRLKGEAIIVENIDSNDNKEITIKNTGESDLVVRVKLFYSGDYVEYADAENKWKQESDGWWYYTEVIPAGGTSSMLKANVVKEKAPTWDFEITVILEYEEALFDSNGKFVTDRSDWTYKDYKGE